MTSEADSVADRVRRDPDFHELVRLRARFAWTLTVLMLAIYFGFILLIAFWPSVLGQPVGTGVTTLGIPVGLGVIVSAFILTAIYVRRANTEFDALTAKIIGKVT